MQSLYLGETGLVYDGSQLKRHWAWAACAFTGDCLVAWVGPCDVKRDHMVDLEDLEAEEEICAAKMLHFVTEHAGNSMMEAVLRQRVLVQVVHEELLLRKIQVGLKDTDFFLDEKKLSVSIATITPSSEVIHLGLNVDASGAPIEAAQLPDWLHIGGLACPILQTYCEVEESLQRRSRKARSVL